VQVPTARRGPLDLGNSRAQRLRQAVAAAEDREANAVVEAALRFGHQRAAEERHEGADLARGPLPVVGRESVERERRDAAVADSCFDDAARRPEPGMVPGTARETARGRPPPVAIHDDGDVQHPWCIGAARKAGRRRRDRGGRCHVYGERTLSGRASRG
jgi:hypothetical protein